MLHDFLAANRAELIDECRRRVGRRSPTRASSAELAQGIPFFIDQLMRTLREEHAPDGKPASASGITRVASEHGRQLLEHGFTVDQVVHDYGDLCQAVTELAHKSGTDIDVPEFRTLNRCLDDAIAGAVTRFALERDTRIADRDAQALNERLGFFAHELRNLIHTATLALTAIKTGNVGVAGATGDLLGRSLIGLRTLVDRSLVDVRVKAGLPPRRQQILLADFIAEARISATLEAQARHCALIVPTVDAALAVSADWELLSSAVTNLLQNAFKYTQPGTEVVLRACASGERALIEVEDHCGGLHPGDAERMFAPFMQLASDRSGLGLGLSICHRSVEANGGSLRVRDVPGSGCIFTIDLPRRVSPQ